MFSIYLISLLTVFFHFCTGKIFSRYLKIDSNSLYDLSLTSIIGIIILSFIALITNFFFPLNQFVNSLIFLILIITFFSLRKDLLKKILSNKAVGYFLFLSSLGIFLFLFLSKIYTPDAALYHFPYINILHENKIMIGISNVHHRFGHVSILQYLSAFHYNYLFGLNGITVPIASIGVYSLILFLSHINNYKNFSISKIFSILLVIYISWKMNRYGEYGNDAPGHLILFILTLIYIKKKEINKKIDENTFYILLFLSLFAFLNKTFLIFAFLIPLICINKKFIKNLINWKFIFFFTFLISWTIKNIFISGCLIYPMPATCLDLTWTNFNYTSNVYQVSAGSEAWSKDWSNQNGIILDHSQYIKNFYWLKFWLNNHFLKILDTLLPYLFFILAFFIILCFSLKKNIHAKKIAYKKYFPIMLVMLIGVIAWFLKAPIYRYGYSYIVILVAVISTLLISKNLQNKKIIEEKKITKIFTFVVILVLISKQLIRISKNYDLNYTNYPWPKYFSYTATNHKISLKKYNKDKKFYFYISDQIYCYYSKSPCTTERVDKNLKKKILNGYVIFYF